MQRIPERRVTQRPAAGRSCAGFTYLGVLFAVALMGAMLVAIATIWHQAQQREKEKQLLFVGKQFRRAIAAYYDNSPGLAKQFPKKLEDLLKDERYPFTTRYLRKIFFDPFTNDTDWGLVKGADGGITGVYSKSDDEPLKKANFDRQFAQFEDRKRYSDWQFIYSPTVAVAQNGSPAAPPPVEAIPPVYVPPPSQPYASSTPDERKKRLCDFTRSSDLLICLNMANKFGNVAGANCLASAASRYSACMNGEAIPTLVVQYQ